MNFFGFLALALLGACAQVQAPPAPPRPPVTAAAVSNPAALPSCADLAIELIEGRRDVLVSPGQTARGLKLGPECLP
jgi:hypothetical protein